MRQLSAILPIGLGLMAAPCGPPPLGGLDAGTSNDPCTGLQLASWCRIKTLDVQVSATMTRHASNSVSTEDVSGSATFSATLLQETTPLTGQLFTWSAAPGTVSNSGTYQDVLTVGCGSETGHTKVITQMASGSDAAAAMTFVFDGTTYDMFVTALIPGTFTQQICDPPNPPDQSDPWYILPTDGVHGAIPSTPSILSGSAQFTLPGGSQASQPEWTVTWTVTPGP